MRGSQALRSAWGVFWPTRLGVLLVAVFAALSFGPATGGLAGENAAKFDEPALTGALADALLQPLARWDAVWYLRIADSGYAGSDARAAFFPLYPLLVRGLATPFGAAPGALLAAAYVVSLGAFLVALTLLHRLVALELGRPLALVFAAVACVGIFRRLPAAYGVWVAGSLVLPLSLPVKPQPLMSLPRFLAVLFPIFMWLAIWSEERRATDRVAAVSALGLGLVTAQFATWHWIA